MLYSVCKYLLRGIFFLLYRLRAVGMENIPKDGPVIICSNHISNIDPPLLGTPLIRSIHYMAKAELFSIPLFGTLIRKLGAYPVKRGGVSKESIKLSIEMLKQGRMLGIFPQGSRSNKSGIGKKGAAMLALKSNAVVVPAAIIGNYTPFRPMTIYFGKPVHLSEFAEGGSDALEQATEKIMAAIGQLQRQRQ
jgi:1-acyl-sn-glycerol-3-phosphate acyltransferase